MQVREPNVFIQSMDPLFDGWLANGLNLTALDNLSLSRNQLQDIHFILHKRRQLIA